MYEENRKVDGHCFAHADFTLCCSCAAVLFSAFSAMGGKAGSRLCG